MDQQVAPPQRPVELGADTAGLARLAGRVFADFEREVDTDHLDLDLPSVDDAIADLQERVEAATEATFMDLVAHCTRRVEVVAYFLALLELARWGAVRVSQDDWHSDIRVRRSEATLEPPRTSEWSR
jgi:chromatin segregation and condensation protein Rec8/ScpA/Scc1 (kleisin family)